MFIHSESSCDWGAYLVVELFVVDLFLVDDLPHLARVRPGLKVHENHHAVHEQH